MVQPSSQRRSRLLGFDERILLALAWIQRLRFLLLSLSGFAFFSHLLLSNIEETLVYFCLLLESEQTAGSDSRPDQTGMCRSWGCQSDQTNVRNTFGTSIFVCHNCLMRSMKLEESLMLHKIMNKPTGWDDQTSSRWYLFDLTPPPPPPKKKTIKKQQPYICTLFLTNCKKFGSSVVQAEGRCEISQAWIFSPPLNSPVAVCSSVDISAPPLCCWPPTDSCFTTSDLLSVRLTSVHRCPCWLCCRERAKPTFYQLFFRVGVVCPPVLHLCGTLTTVTFGWL